MIEQLRAENQLLKDLINLKDEEYYRKGLLDMLEKIAESMEKFRIQ
jgi:hypothetical protein